MQEVKAEEIIAAKEEEMQSIKVKHINLEIEAKFPERKLQNKMIEEEALQV